MAVDAVNGFLLTAIGALAGGFALTCVPHSRFFNAQGALQLVGLLYVKLSDVAYRYTIEKIVRTVYVSHAQRNDLATGRIGIVWHHGRGSLMPRGVAERLMGKIPGRVWLASQHEEPEESDDPYAEFKVPDDLMW